MNDLERQQRIRDVEKLQRLLDQDSEFADLVTGASRNTASSFGDTIEDLLAIKDFVPAFKQFDVEEYFAIYKVILAWCTLVGKILNKIHGKGSMDSSAGIQIPGTTKIVNIYTAPAPWMVRVYIDKDSTNPEVYIEECVSVIDKATGKLLRYANIEFRLSNPRPRIIYNPVIMTYTPNLKESWMSISIKDFDNNTRLDGATFQVRDFNPGELVDVVRKSFNI